MRDSMKMTVTYQFMYILLTQVLASAAVMLFGLVFFWYFTSMHIVKEILSVIFMIAAFAMLYTSSKRFAVLDNKPYTPLKRSLIKGALFGAVVAAVNVVFTVVYHFIWVKFGTDAGLANIPSVIVNVVYFYWTYPYNGIMNMNDGNITYYSALAMVVVPIAATLLGYIAGCRKFNLTEKLGEFMYEKE